MFDLPAEIMCYIYEFDPTYRNLYSMIIKSMIRTSLYHSNGNLYREFQYNLNYQFHGKSRSYHYNGKLMNFLSLKNEKYINGLLNGPYFSYFDNGNIFCVTTFVNGKKNGDCTFYHKNGNLREQCIYKCGKKNPTQTISKKCKLRSKQRPVLQ